MQTTPVTETRRPLHLDDWVTPTSFDPARFEVFSSLTVEEEFDLIAPVAIYHHADMAPPWKSRARQALQALRKLKHPLVADALLKDLLETTQGISGLQSRYNALVLTLVASHAPTAEPYIDAWGAYAFRLDGDDCVLAGDSAGWFAFYSNAESLQNRLRATG